MKLLLTSGGLRNATLVDALRDLVQSSANEIKIAFIPTAQNIEKGDKSWVIDQMVRLRDMKVAQLDIVDIAALNKSDWLSRLVECNVIFVNGGNTTYLMNWFNQSGLTQEIPKLLEERVYVGVSAGSYIATPDTRFNSDNVDTVLDGLGLVDFGLQAHLHSPKFRLAKTDEVVKKRVAGCPYTVYALDDEMAVMVVGDHVQVVGEGEYLKFEPPVEKSP